MRILLRVLLTLAPLTLAPLAAGARLAAEAEQGETASVAAAIFDHVPGGIAPDVVALPAGRAAARATQPASVAALRARLQRVLDSAHAAGRSPGMSAGIVLADGTVIALAAGLADTALRLPLRPADRLLQGSVGKTYVAAVALQLVHEGKLALDERIQRHLGGEPWFPRLAHSGEITVRHLMTHTSGVVRYEFKEEFTRDLTAQPRRVWRPEEQIAYLLDDPAPFAPGAGWEYSDTNYILLGMIIERITGARYHDELRRRILDPLGLRNTVPVDGPRIPGLAQGYAGPRNPFGGADAMLADGELAINPQFEWTGGGIASTSEDLARWAKELYEGRAFHPSLLPRMLDAVPSRLGPTVRYGLGVMVRTTPLGPAWGHSGFFPGYLADVMYFPELRIAVAVQVNSSTARSPAAAVVALARAAADSGGARAPAPGPLSDRRSRAGSRS